MFSLCFILPFLHSQTSFQDFLSGKEKISIPFELKGHLIIVRVLLDNRLPLNFILDTGSPYTVLFEKIYADLLQIPYSDTIHLAGADQTRELKGHIARRVKLGIKSGHVAVRDIVILSEDYFRLKNYIGYDVHGILGMDFFKTLILQIDYRRRKISFALRNKKPLALKAYSRYPLTLHHGKPYLRLPIQMQADSGSHLTANLLLDTGAGLNMLLLNGSHPQIRLPKKHIRGFIGAGLGGDVEGYLSRIHSYEFGGLKYENIPGYFQALSTPVLRTDSNWTRHGILGNKLLENYSLILDNYTYILYVKPYNKKVPKFDIDKSGLLIYAGGRNFDKFIIGGVLPGSPADLAGIIAGDQIIKIGWFPASWYQVSQINHILSGRNGKKIHLTMNRNGKKLKVHFRLQSLI